MLDRGGKPFLDLVHDLRGSDQLPQTLGLATDIPGVSQQAFEVAFELQGLKFAVPGPPTQTRAGIHAAPLLARVTTRAH